MPGRRPKPLAMHALNGNPSMMSKAELSGSDNPRPDPGLPEMPKGMPKAARREWKQVTKLLLANGLLTNVDGKALAGYCICFARQEEAQKLIDKFGPVIQTSFLNREGDVIIGDLKANPAVAMADKWLARMKSFLVEFGLTPASRRNLHVEAKKPGDEMEDYLSQKRPRAPITVRPEDMSAGDEEPV